MTVPPISRNEFARLESRLAMLETRIGQIDQQYELLGIAFDEMLARVAAIEARLPKDE